MSRKVLAVALSAIILMLTTCADSTSRAAAAGPEALSHRKSLKPHFGREYRDRESKICVHPVAVCAPAPCTRIEKRTVFVPQWVTECKQIPTTEIRHEERDREIITYKDVPEIVQKTRMITVMEHEVRSHEETYTVEKPVKEKVEQTYTVCVPYTETRTGTRTVLKPVYKEIERKYTVNVPVCEKRTGTRCVSRCVPVVHTRDICVDRGHFEERVSHPVCKTCGPCGPVAVAECKTRVWVPVLVHKQEAFTVNTKQTVQVPYEYDVTVMRPEIRTKIEKVCTMVPTPEPYTYEVQLTRNETRSRLVEVCKLVPEVRTRTVNERVCVPRQRTETYNETVYHRVAVKRICKETVCVPVCTTRDVQVRVCRLLPKTVEVQVAATPVCYGPTFREAARLGGRK
jgi:hypothetical protein